MGKKGTEACLRWGFVGWMHLACAFMAEAQMPADTTGNGLRRMPGVTVTERRLPVSLFAGSPLQRMDRAELERFGALEVSDAVRHFSGVSVKDYGGIGGMKTVSVRSLGAQHTAVCYDGVSVGDCQSGQVDISRFSLDNVSALSLTVGQSDDIFQPARMLASAGVLAIETARPDFDKDAFRLTGLFMAITSGRMGAIRSST